MARVAWRGQNALIPFQEMKRDYIGSDTNTEDDKLASMLLQASAWVESYTDRKFMPFVATRTYDDPADAYLLYLDEDLLSVTTLTTENGTVTISSNYRLVEQNLPPYWAIELTDNTSNSFTSSTDAQNSTSVTGVWGYHQTTYDSGATVNETFTDSDTVLTVDDLGPFEAGMHLLIESEQCFVISVGSTLKLARGINGTTAAAHSSSTAISIYRPPEDIVAATGILTARLMQRGQAAGTDLAGTPQAGFRITRQVPADVQAILNQYVRNNLPSFTDKTTDPNYIRRFYS